MVANVVGMNSAFPSYAQVEGSELPWWSPADPVPTFRKGATPAEVLDAASLNWEVKKANLFFYHDGKQVKSPQKALVRVDNGDYMSSVGENWNPVQNSEVAEFFGRLTEKANAEFATAMALDEGRHVVLTAELRKERFEVVPGDEIRNYLTFSTRHKYGTSTRLFDNQTRVVCQNTFLQSLQESHMVDIRLNHSWVFDGDKLAQMLLEAGLKSKDYQEKARFLTRKAVNDNEIREYINTLFPLTAQKAASGKHDFSLVGKQVFENFETQPGAEFGRGTAWQLFNAVTFTLDHVAGRSEETRTESAWFGANSNRKAMAMDMALKLAA